MESEKKKNIESLLYCARCGSLEGVKFDIEKKHVDVNSTDNIGRTALHEAAYGEGGNDYSRYNEVVEYLISKGAEIDKKTECDDPERSGATPFSYAVMQGKVDVAKTLIKHGADTKVIVNGFNFLDLAIKSDNPEMIKLALGYGYDINQYGVLQATPLASAVSSGYCESIKFLLEKGADYRKYYCEDNPSPLCCAAQEKKQNGRCIKLLLEHVEKKEGKERLLEYINFNGMKMGRTALHGACFRQNYHAVKILLEYGADTSIKDEEGFLASDLLEALGNTNVRKQIESLFQQENKERSK